MPIDAIVAVIVKDGKTLFIARPPGPWSGRWGPVSGKIEPGEEQAAAGAGPHRDRKRTRLTPRHISAPPAPPRRPPPSPAPALTPAAPGGPWGGGGARVRGKVGRGEERAAAVAGPH